MSDVAESEPKISSFVSTNEYWRIDCLGSLSFDTPGLESQPTISVAVSKAAQHPPVESECWKTNATLTKAQRIEKIPVSILPNLKTGDFWFKNQLAISPVSYHKKKLSLGLSQLENATCICLGDEAPWSPGPNNREYWLPFHYHPYHKLFTRANAQLIELSDGLLLIIPHWEIIRFYFGSSTQLVEWLFNVNATYEDLYDESRCSKSADGHGHLHLRSQIPYNSATDVARICFDAKVRKTIEILRNSLTAQSANQRPVFPKIKLPIFDSTTLEMKGRSIKYANGKQAFICYELISCSAPLPFTSLSYFKDMPGDTNPDQDRSQLTPMSVRAPKEKNGAEDKKKESLIEPKDANTTFGSQIYQIDVANRFPYLNTVNVEKRRIDPYTHYSEPGYHPELKGNLTEGVGHGGNDERQSAKLQRKEHQLNTSPKPSINFEYFFEAMDLLKLKVSSVDYICPTAEPDRSDHRCAILPLAKTERGGVSKLNFIDYVKGKITTKKLRRRAIIAKVTFNKGIAYLLEIETRVYNGKQLDAFPTYLVSSITQSELTNREIDDVLKHFSKNHFLWSIPTQLPYVRGIALRHPHKRPDENRDSYIKRLYKSYLSEIKKFDVGKKNEPEQKI